MKGQGVRVRRKVKNHWFNVCLFLHVCFKTTICLFWDIFGPRSGFFGEDKLANLSKQQTLSFMVSRCRRGLGFRQGRP